eukprot:TRINITY_DN1635_c0_g1_i6.p2 TRINITY_DN1635_c0_g1~~TRINITY_DN1635_c0_g1_i6.p2  ORF type:complete len:104 (-),score=22.11 TRINITY_DN1635_c0_g1_i6:99-410(-)
MTWIPTFENLNTSTFVTIHAVAPHIPVVLIGNKKDLESERKVTYNMGYQEAVFHNVEFIETSAKTGENVAAAFQKLAELCVREPAGTDTITLGQQQPHEKKHC